MRLGIRLHGRTDVVALAVHDDDHALALCIANGFGQCPHSLPAVQLIVGCLWLDSRNDVADSVDDGFVVLQDCLCCRIKAVAVLLKLFVLDVLRDIVEQRIQSHYAWVLHLCNLLNQSFHLLLPPSYLLLQLILQFIYHFTAQDGLDHPAGQLHFIK